MEKIGYVSIEDANVFIASHFLSSSDERKEWDALSDDDKKVLLLNAFEDIENNIFVGYKTYQNQKTQWPRNGSTEVPDDIKAAQIYETIELGFGDNSANDAIEKGIKGESIGKISTEYFASAYYSIKYNTIKSTKAKKILNKYIKVVFDVI